MANDEALAGEDYVFEEESLERLPGFARRVLADFTYREAHAVELGFLGILAAAAVHLGFASLAVFGSGFLIAIAFGIEERYLKAILGERGERVCERARNGRVARRMLRLEPWYFTTSFIANASVTFLVIELFLGGFGA